MGGKPKIEVKATADTKQAEAGLDKLKNKTEDVADSAQEASKSADKLSDSFGKLGGNIGGSVGDMAKAVATGNLVSAVFEEIGKKIGEAIIAMVNLGAQTEQTIARFGAMKNNLTQAAEAYQLFNDVGRNTNYDMNAINDMGAKLINLGYNAKQAAELIAIVSDTAAGLGKGQEGAQALMDSLNRMRSTGMFTIRDMKSLQEEGIHVEEALAKAFGTDTQTAMEMVKKGAVDGKDAFEILANYMESEFADSMANSKNNVTDMWGDIAGNVQTVCGEMGLAIYDAFNQSEIMQDMIQITQDFVDLVRSDGEGVFHDLKEVASWALGIIGDMLKGIWEAIKLVIIIGDEMYQAFKSIGRKIADALEPILTPLGEIWRIVSGIVKALGKEVAGGIDASWQEKFGSNAYDPTDSYGATDAVNYKGNGKYSFSNGSGSEKSSGSSSVASATSDAAAKIKSEFEFSERLIKAQKDAYEKLTQAKDKNTQASLIGEALKQAQLQSTIDAMNRAQEIDNEATMRKIDNMKEQRKAYEDAISAGIAQDGTQEKIDNLTKQIAVEEELLGVRQQTTDLQIKAAQTKSETERSAEIAKALEHEKSMWEGYAMSLSSSMGDAVASVITGQKSIGDALSEIARSLITNALSVMAQWVSLVAILAAFGDPTPARHASIMMFGVGDQYVLGANGGYTPKPKANGGLIVGPGTGTSDTAGIFALSNGEYVMPASAVSRLGTPFLDGLATGHIGSFASGGIVGSSGVYQASSSDLIAGSSSNNVVLNVSAIDASGFGAFLERGGLQTIKQALVDDNRSFGAASTW